MKIANCIKCGIEIGEGEFCSSECMIQSEYPNYE